MSSNKRFYIIQKNKILLHSKDQSFPDNSIIGEDHTSHQIEMGRFEAVDCKAVIPSDNWQLPDSFEFFSIKQIIRNTDRNDLKLAGLAGFLCSWILNTKFCGRCGVENEMSIVDKARICPGCGLVSYPRFSPAIIVAVIKEDKILLAHNRKFTSGIYSTIAGFLDAGETFEECVKREVFEEVGIKITNIKYFGNQPWLFPDSHMIGFTADYESGEIKEDGIEIEHADWYQAEELPMIPSKGSISRELIDWFIKKKLN